MVNRSYSKSASNRRVLSTVAQPRRSGEKLNHCGGQVGNVYSLPIRATAASPALSQNTQSSILDTLDGKHSDHRGNKLYKHKRDAKYVSYLEVPVS